MVYSLRGLMVALAVFMSVSMAVTQAAAHSTKGRIKVPLDLEAITTDDVAYFVESYVHRQLYSGVYEKWKNRFYVNAFLGVEQKGDRADVHFKVLDVKKTSISNDVMTLNRGGDGIWHFNPGGGQEVREVYTYVQKSRYYYKKYVLPVSATGCVVMVAVLGTMTFMKRKKKETAA